MIRVYMIVKYMKLIIVESPAISKYLDNSYMLAASYGHIATKQKVKC